MTSRFQIRRETLGDDAIAGLVLGVESVPDGLAAGLLAGVNPLSGLYAYMFGTLSGSVTTSSSFMAVQATGAMAVIISDVPTVHTSSDPARALFTLAMVTGLIMIIAGFLKLGSALRFVSNAVMVGFISAVGVNIVLGQLANFTGYKAAGANRVVRAFNTLIHPGQLHLGTRTDRYRDHRPHRHPGADQAPRPWPGGGRHRYLRRSGDLPSYRCRHLG